ncbi:MAG: sigma-54-dependent Fis family transcriptional regulator [Candidatus Schekmanbacteria bacterium]|nr:sigma-54-dependent Fis family transcriptional regulator [Candidatus Schekmanbacteria bacterium]
MASFKPGGSPYPADGLVTVDHQMHHIEAIARQVADVDVPILLLGESGVGKGVVARYIHRFSARARAPFVDVNCAAVPRDLLESEFFGHERGAFTGAVQQQIGQFELAENGTIFLDEIGEMDPAVQAKLLHVLQDGELRRVGGAGTTKVQCRVIAATNCDLKDAVREGRFRADLYYRLAVIKLEIPPLRERPDDVVLLSRYFLGKYASEYRRPVPELPRSMEETFRHYRWPGNVRELENAIKRYVLLPDAAEICADLSESMDPHTNGTTAMVARVAGAEGPMSLLDIGAQAADEAERQAVVRMLEATNWNRKAAAERLNVCYKTLLNKLRRWEIDDRAPVWTLADR